MPLSHTDSIAQIFLRKTHKNYGLLCKIAKILLDFGYVYGSVATVIATQLRPIGNTMTKKSKNRKNKKSKNNDCRIPNIPDIDVGYRASEDLIDAMVGIILLCDKHKIPCHMYSTTYNPTIVARNFSVIDMIITFDEYNKVMIQHIRIPSIGEVLNQSNYWFQQYALAIDDDGVTEVIIRPEPKYRIGKDEFKHIPGLVMCKNKFNVDIPTSGKPYIGPVKYMIPLESWSESVKNIRSIRLFPSNGIMSISKCEIGITSNGQIILNDHEQKLTAIMPNIRKGKVMDSLVEKYNLTVLPTLEGMTPETNTTCYYVSIINEQMCLAPCQ